MKIYAPVKDATGVWCSVYFKNGVGETKNPHLIEWFKNHGYKIEGEMEEAPIEVVTISNELDFESMSVDELREWMKTNGLGSKVKNIKNKEKLIEIIRG